MSLLRIAGIVGLGLFGVGSVMNLFDLWRLITKNREPSDIRCIITMVMVFGGFFGGCLLIAASLDPLA